MMRLGSTGFHSTKYSGMALKSILVNARHVKNVPGRTTDSVMLNGCSKLHRLRSCSRSFSTRFPVSQLRAYFRPKGVLVRYRSSISNTAEAIMQIESTVASVVEDIMGLTCTRIIDAIFQVKRCRGGWAALRDPRCKESQTTIAARSRKLSEEHLLS